MNARVNIRTLILGSGIIGLTTAFSLQARGHEVVVVDRRDGVGRETTLANGGLLTPSMSAPWNSPGSWRLLLQSFVQPNSPLKLRARALPSLLTWGPLFLRNSTPSLFEKNTHRNLRLSLHSMSAMAHLRAVANVEYGRRQQGTLRIFRDTHSFNAAYASSKCLASCGVQVIRLTPAEAVLLEPALAPIKSDLTGAIHYPADESGDALAFSNALYAYLQARGVEFLFRTNIRQLKLSQDRISYVDTSAGALRADHVVVAAGASSPSLLRSVGIDVPVKPVKGYSVTFPHSAEHPHLRVPIVDDHLHAVVTPMTDSVRVAGTAEFASFDLSLRPERVQNLIDLLRRVLPEQAFKPEDATPWCGLRPVTPDGVPIIGPTAIQNLWVNTGHGHLGWTMAAGSAALLCGLIAGDEPSLDPRDYSLARFSSGHGDPDAIP